MAIEGQSDASRPADVLVGREAECARIDGLLTEARRGQSGGLVLVGEPGIGKSSLCDYARRRATGATLLSARGIESEVAVPFAGLSELLSGEMDRLERLPGPQAAALRGALALSEGAPVDRFTVGAAVLTLLASAAERGPVLAMVDDAQWIDTPSAEALVFAGRRLRTEGVALLFATRGDGRVDVSRNGMPELRVGGLDPGAAWSLLATASARPIAPGVAAEIIQRTGGNPLALLEAPTLLSEAQLSGAEPLEQPLPAGTILERAFLARISALSESARRALLLAAASDSEDVQPVVDALAGLGIEARVLDAAERSGAVALASDQIVFSHPLLRSAVYHGASGPDRRAAHLALAGAVVGERRAWHLAAATIGCDETVAEALESAGEEAHRRGAPGAAARALERAARLTPDGESRARRLVSGAHDAYLAGRPRDGMEMLDRALTSTRDAARRAELQHLRGRILVMQGQGELGYELLVAEAERVRELDPARAVQMLAEAALDCLTSGRIAKGAATARAGCAVAERVGPGAETAVVAMLATGLILGGDGPAARPLLRTILPVLSQLDPLSAAGFLVVAAAHCFIWLEEHATAEELLDRLIGAARAASAPGALPWALVMRSELSFRTGRWTDARADAAEAGELADELGQAPVMIYALDCLARIEAARGERASCRSHGERALAIVEATGLRPGRTYVQATLGFLELGLGRVEEAIRQLEPVGAMAEEHGLREPGVIPWAADLIEAYVRAGQVASAANVLRTYEGRARRVERTSALAAAARCRGLLASDSAFASNFETALTLHAMLPDPFERARTKMCYGERLRRAGRRKEARAKLRSAIDSFDRLDAKPWADRARAELAATGERLRPRERSATEELTPQELQVARIVATGASNREAAAALFVSPKTIEFHLGHIYSKLGLRSRTQLSAMLAKTN